MRMHNIRFLRIQYQPEISTAELPKFRGAIVAAVTREHRLFHNHLSDDKLRYAYPLIQYKRIGGKPVIVCINEGTDEIHALFQQHTRSLHLGHREIELTIESIVLKEWTLQVGTRLHPYQIRQWLALSPEHYTIWRNMQEPSEKNHFLSSILRGNLLAMAKGLGWFIQEQVEVQLHHVSPPRPIPYKDTRLMAFDATFSCNIALPNSIGLGKGAAKGFGVVGSAQNSHQRRQ